MAALQRRILHLRQQPRAEVLATKLLVDRHALDDVGGKPCAPHQLRAGPGFDEQRDVVVQAKAAVCQQVTDLTQAFRVFRHQRVAKIDGLRMHAAALLNVLPRARRLALPRSRC